ncbi:divalent-cation tolerance protein CutA [Pseudomarimonas arenosa]|uniref:Divalent-cation tolerance protein CutA n=1 Tax=Pseudomarimonas arenosa TaxID=2774145 RepID=A0AAW3ZS01_9GAMM|nr:divalent-cation tolerance protein CutA [Pseudomarimonas arenosa]MBD8527844.1 divalent-cation tolerance protein CutA [Pseudomarimonas arenosa]
MSDLRLYFCTCPDSASAERLAAALVEQGLAACVNLLPGIRSIYRWQGTIEQGEEVLLLIKSRDALFTELSAAVLRLHPYELPELIAVKVDSGLPAYLDWLRAETGRPD